MNPALLITTVATNAAKGHEWERTYYCKPYTPRPRPDCVVSVSIKTDSYVTVESSIKPDVVDIRFRNENGLDELNEFIRKLIKARDRLDAGLKEN